MRMKKIQKLLVKLTLVVFCLSLSLFVIFKGRELPREPPREPEHSIQVSTPRIRLDALHSPSNPWIQYRNDWRGETLIQSNKVTKQISLPKRYVLAMLNKGPHPLSRIYPKFLERQTLIKKNCPDTHAQRISKLDLGESLFFFHFNDDYEVVNCLIPKAASNAWTIQFGKMIDPSFGTSKELVRNISMTNHLDVPVETARRIQTYTKFFVHRHPFERLVSAYINKFGQPRQYIYMDMYAKRIIISNYLNKYPKNKMLFERDFQHLRSSQKQEILKQIDRLDSAQDKFNITFTEFVNFITSSLDDKAIDKLDIHWKPVSRICNPCAVRYDVVIDHDNIAEESQMLLNFLQKNKPTNHPLYFEPYPRTSTREKCDKYFSKVPMNLREKLYQLYYDDFLLFGYTCNINSKDYACDGFEDY